VESRHCKTHDDDFQEFYPADKPGFLVLVRQLAGRGGKQEKRQDEQAGAQIDKRIGFPQTLARGLESDKDNQRVLVNVVIERPEKLGQEKRGEPRLLQQRELIVCRTERPLRG
jgi:hypothetical protein